MRKNDGKISKIFTRKIESDFEKVLQNVLHIQNLSLKNENLYFLVSKVPKLLQTASL